MQQHENPFPTYPTRQQHEENLNALRVATTKFRIQTDTSLVRQQHPIPPEGPVLISDASGNARKVNAVMWAACDCGGRKYPDESQCAICRRHHQSETRRRCEDVRAKARNPMQPKLLPQALTELAAKVPALRRFLDNSATRQDAEQLANLVTLLGAPDLAPYIRQIGQGAPVQVVLGQIATNGELVRELQALQANWEHASDLFAAFGFRK